MDTFLTYTTTQDGHLSPILYVYMNTRATPHGEETTGTPLMLDDALSLSLSLFLSLTLYRRFHVYQHVTSFSHMRGALVGRRTTAAGFHMQNMCDV